MRENAVRGFVVSWLVLVGPWVASATIPVVHEPVTAIVKSGATFVPVSITGWGLGPETGSEVDVVSASGTTTLGTSHADVVLWNDRQIVVKISPTLESVSMRVRHPGGESMAFPVEYFRYDSFGTAAPASVPIDVAVDGTGRVWIIAQFHDSIRYWDPSDETVHTVSIPHASGTGAFNSFGVRTWNSPIGDDIAIDSLGRLWWAQGGGAHATLPAYSRIVSYDPSAPGFKIWNVPGNQSWATHVAWDAVNARLWFTQLPRTLCNNQVGGSGVACTTAQPARLVAFYPDDHGGALPHDNTFDFDAATTSATCTGFSQNSYPTPPTAGTCAGVTPTRSCFTAADCVLADKICDDPPVDETECFREYDITDSAAVRGPSVDAAGDVWFASALPASSGVGYLGRLTPSTGVVTSVPFRGYDVPSNNAFADASGVQAVEVAVGPNGDVVVAEANAARVSRLRKAQLDLLSGAFCLSLLGVNDSNVCMTELLSPNYCDRSSGTCVLGAGTGSGILDKRVRDVGFDAFGNTWFTQRGRTTGSPSTSLGLVRPGFGRAAMLPPLSLYGGAAFQGGGVEADPTTNAVWFADTDRRELGRLRAMPVAFGPATALRRTGLSTVPMSVTGSGFGLPIDGSEIVIEAGATTLDIPATDASVRLWSDRQIVVEVDDALADATVTVTTPAGTSATVATEYFQYDAFPADVTPTGAPLDPVLDQSNGRVWLVEEYHSHLSYWDPVSGDVELIPDSAPAGQTTPDLIPHAATAGAFALQWFCAPPNQTSFECDYREWRSAWGEDIVVDGTGRAWFGQSGNVDRSVPNHARLVSYDPNLSVGSRFKIWNLPGNDTGAPFLAWDEVNDRMWMSVRRQMACNFDGGLFSTPQCTTIRKPRLMSFRPNAGLLAPNNTFDFEAAAADPDNECVGFSQETYPDKPIPGACVGSGAPCFDERDCVLLESLCGPGQDDDECFKAYDLQDPDDLESPSDPSDYDDERDTPAFVEAAHIELSDGAIWITTYMNQGRLGRFDVTTGDQAWYPLRTFETPGLRWAFGTSLWETRVSDGDPIFTEYGASRLSRLDGDQVGNAACEDLVSVHAGTDCEALPDATCDNPCVTQMFPPNLCTTNCSPWTFGGDLTVKSVVPGPDGRTWFTEVGRDVSNPTTESIGFLEDSASARLIMLPPIGLVMDPGFAHRGAGIDVDTTTGELWVTEIKRRELVRITPLP